MPGCIHTHGKNDSDIEYTDEDEEEEPQEGEEEFDSEQSEYMLSQYHDAHPLKAQYRESLQ